MLAAALVLAVLARTPWRGIVAAANPALLVGVFAVAISLGALARSVESLADLGETLGRWSTAGVAAGISSSCDVDRSQSRPEPCGDGSALSAVLWLQVACAVGARPSVWRYTQLGIVIVPVTMSLALAALRLFIPPSF